MSVLLGGRGVVRVGMRVLPQVQQGVGAPGPPALGAASPASAGSRPSRRARCGRRCRWAGRRRGGRARASRCSRPSRARCRAAPAARRRTSSRSAPRSSAHVAVGQRRGTARPAPGPASAASAAPRGRAPASVAAVGKRWVSPATSARRRGLPYSRDEPRRRRCGRRPRVTCWPSTARTASLVAVDVPGHAQAGRAADQRAEHRVAGERVVDRHRVAVGVEQPADALDRGRGVAQVVRAGTSPARTPSARRSASSSSSSRTVPGPCGQVERAGVRSPSPATSTPGTHVVGEEVEQRPAGERRAHGEPHASTVPPRRRRRRGGRAARSASRRRPRGPCR